jgi:hypothetical protein
MRDAGNRTKNVWRLSMHTDRARIDYLKTEIEIGIALARIALRSEDAKKTDRNRAYARTAYETVRGFSADRRIMLTIAAADLAVLQRKLIYLRDLLRQLGESFPS